MKGFLKSKLIFTLVAVVLLGTVLASGFIGHRSTAHAASRSSLNIGYVNYDDSGFTESGIPSANIFTNAIIGGPAATSSATAPVTYNGMTFTPLKRADISSATLANYDTLILFEICDINTSLSSAQHDAINAYLAAGNKILLYDADRCAPGDGGNADYSWFTYPFSTSNPGPQGATGNLTVVENSTLTQGLSSDPFNSDELGDANTATTSDPHWFAAARTTNALGTNGYFLAYARNSGLIIYNGADYWFSFFPTKSLTDLFLNELNQQYDPDNLPSTVPIASAVNYVALGDSFSSGEGNPPFFAGTDGPSDYCHRSPQAYSQVLGAAFGLQPKFYACSGAVTDNITTTSKDGEPPQIQEPGVDTTAGLLTMTIGGNNAGFSDILTSCIEQKVKADLHNAVIGPVGIWLGLGLDPSCADSGSFVDSANTRIDNVFHPVKDTYKALLGQVSKTGTSVIVADYPHLFPDSSSEQSCLALSLFLTAADQQYFNTAGDRLDGVLQTAAGQAGVNFVDVRSIFAGHGVCGNGGAWVNGLSIASGSGSCTFSAFGICIIPGFPPLVGSFHPNASGHADGYAAAFESYIKSATNRTPQGYPANPLALPDPPTVTATAADVVQTLTARPVTTGTVDCEGTYQAGQQLSVNGDGFAPGASVQLYMTSPGLTPAGEQQVAQLTADSAGHVASTIRIPLTATGFTPSGSKAGLIFVDAIGSGPGGVHIDDVAMEGLAPHSSSCGTVEQLPFDGFYPPVANLPQVNTVQPGQSVPVKFALPGISATINDVLASGYPQSGPVPCSNPGSITIGDPTVSANGNASSSLSDKYNYVWKTDPSWRGCRELIVKLVDGSYHQAVFDFGT